MAQEAFLKAHRQVMGVAVDASGNATPIVPR